MWKCFWLGPDRAVQKEKKKIQTNGGRSGLCTRIKELGRSTLLFIFDTLKLPASIRWKNNKLQNYDECSQKEEAAANVERAECIQSLNLALFEAAERLYLIKLLLEPN